MIKEILRKEKTDKCLEEHIFLLEQQRHLLFYSRRRFPRLWPVPGLPRSAV